MMFYYSLTLCLTFIGLNAYVAAELSLLQPSMIQRYLFYQRCISLLLGVLGLVYLSEYTVPAFLVWATLPLLVFMVLLYREARELRAKRRSHLWYQISGTSEVVVNTCVITIRPNTGIIINTAGHVEQIFGTPVETVTEYESFYGFLRASTCAHPDMDIELMIAHLRERTLIPAVEIALRCKPNYEEQWVRQTVGHVTNIYRETVAINLYYTSITQQKAIETELFLIRHALDNLPLGVVITDDKRRIKFINKMELAYHEIRDAREVLGAPSSLLGCEALRTMPPEFEHFEPHLTINTTLKQLIPKLFPCSLTSNYVEDESGRTVGVVTICQPITPMTSTVTTEILSVRDRIALISQQTDVVIIILKSDKTVKLWNRYARFIFGWTEAEAIANSHNTLNLLFGPSISAIEQSIDSRLAVDAQDISVWAKDGAEYRMTLVVHPLLTGEVALLGVIHT